MNGNDGLVRALDPRYYLDPEVYQRELGGMMAATWQYAGHASQLQNKGDYLTFEIAGQNLFCIRNGNGEIRAFYNVCQHRAHELLIGDGTVRSIVCPYHAWTYGFDGKLIGGPNTNSVPGFDASGICLSSVRIEDFHGFLFANLDDNAKPMDEWFPEVREQLLEFVPHIAELQPTNWIKVSKNCNWKLAVENYSECYHCRINHKTFANGVIDPSTYDIQPQGYCLRHTTRCQNLDKMTYPIDLDSYPTAGSYSSWYLWPMFSFQVYPGNVLNTYHWHPKGHDTVDVWRGWYTVGGKKSDVIDTLARQDRDTTVEEDIHLVESVQRGLGSRGYNPGPLVIDPNSGVNSEHSISVLHSWIRESIESG